MASGASSRWKQPPVLLEEVSLNSYVLVQTYLLRAVTGLGFLALTWSTLVHLGGSVTSLGKDFWCLTVISMILAARIFDDLAENRFANFGHQVMQQLYLKCRELDMTMTMNDSTMRVGKGVLYFFLAISLLLGITIIVPCVIAVGLPLIGIGFIYDLGPYACIAISCWRIAKRDYIDDNTHGDNSKANLVPALNIFYSLILCQGAFYCAWKLSRKDCIKNRQVAPLRQLFEITKNDWGSAAIAAYISDTLEKCWKDPGSIHGRKLIHYAVDMLDAESWQENLLGARMLAAFIGQGAEIRPLLLPSKPKIQKLIDMLGWRCGSPEIREVAAHIVVALASDIHLAQFPRATYCISSLLQGHTTMIHACEIKHPQRKEPNRNQNMLAKVCMIWTKLAEGQLTKLQEQTGKMPEQKEPEGSAGNDSGCSAEMILQGLRILEGLASNHHNCKDICTTPGLLRKITAPLYSDTLIQDMGISGMLPDLLNTSLKVLHCLICAPGQTGQKLRHKISRNKKAIDNLEMILHLTKEKKPEIVLEQDNRAPQELKIQAMKILTELALDLSIKLPKGTKEIFIKKQLQTFLDAEGKQEADFMPVKVMAGTTLVSLTSNSKSNCDLILEVNNNDNPAPPTGLLDKDNDAKLTEDIKDINPNKDNNKVVADLTELLSASNDIRYRKIAAEILDNLCTKCDWNKHKQILQEPLLSKVLSEILGIKSDQPERKFSEEKGNKPQARRLPVWKRENSRGNQEELATGKDLESQKETDEQSQRICVPGDKNTIHEISSSGVQELCDQQNDETASTKELHEALLSIALKICGKQINAGDAIPGLEDDAFVVKLKTIIDDNCQPTASCLRIVKLCGWIAESMMQSQSYAEHFMKSEFAQSLSKASKIMSRLESCMVFVGTDFERKKTVRPLLSELEKTVSDLQKTASDDQQPGNGNMAANLQKK